MGNPSSSAPAPRLLTPPPRLGAQREAVRHGIADPGGTARQVVAQMIIHLDLADETSPIGAERERHGVCESESDQCERERPRQKTARDCGQTVRKVTRPKRSHDSNVHALSHASQCHHGRIVRSTSPFRHPFGETEQSHRTVPRFGR